MLDDVVHTWDAWIGSLRGGRTLRRWTMSEPALAGWTAADLRQPQSSQQTDAMQAALVALGQAGDSAAVLTLLVQFRPALGALAAWLRTCDRRFTSFDVAAAEVRSTFCEVLMRHDLDRRPAKIAANVVLDTRQRLWRNAHRVRAEVLPGSSGEVAGGRELDDLAVDDTAHRARSGDGAWPEAVATLDLAASVATAIERLGGSDSSRRVTAELAYRIWFLDEPSGDVARALGLEANAARTRLCRLRAAVRALEPEPLMAA